MVRVSLQKNLVNKNVNINCRSVTGRKCDILNKSQADYTTTCQLCVNYFLLWQPALVSDINYEVGNH